MFMFRIDHKPTQAFWLHDPKHSAPQSVKQVPNRKALMASWITSRLNEEVQREVDLIADPPKPFFPMKLVLAVYPTPN